MTLYRFALLTSFATFVLLVVGGTVNPTGSSLACPDWPTCYGSFFPEMTNGVEFEHTHRVVASVVGFLTVLLAVFLFKSKSAPGWLKKLSYFAAFLVAVQGTLGGVTVLLKLPPAVSITHLAISMIFFSITILIAFALAPRKSALFTGKMFGTAGKKWAFFVFIAVYIQIMLGGMMRHLGAGRICGTELPFCNQSVWPDWPLQQLHMLHRLFAVFVTIVVFVGSFKLMRLAKAENRKLLYVVSFVSPYIVCAQFLFGLLTVASGVGLWEVTAHMAFGALLLASSVLMYLGASEVRSEYSDTKLGAQSATELSTGKV